MNEIIIGFATCTYVFVVLSPSGRRAASFAEMNIHVIKGPEHAHPHDKMHRDCVIFIICLGIRDFLCIVMPDITVTMTILLWNIQIYLLSAVSCLNLTNYFRNPFVRRSPNERIHIICNITLYKPVCWIVSSTINIITAVTKVSGRV